MYLQICTYPRRDLCPLLLFLRPAPAISLVFFFFVLLATTLSLPGLSQASNNQVDVEQRASLIPPPLYLLHLFYFLLSYLVSPFLSARTYVNHRSERTLYARHRIYLHDNIISFLAYTRTGYPFSLLIHAQDASWE